MSPRQHSPPRPSVRLAQNFLKDPSLITALVSQADLNGEDIVLEIGPGRGIITKELAKVCRRVLAIEVEAGLAALLTKQFRELGNVDVINADMLQSELPNHAYKVFSNIPFNITADILRKLLYGNNTPARAYLIIQREAAGKYSGLQRQSQASLLLKPWYDFHIVHQFHRSDFEPVPGVDVVLLDIQRREHPLVTSADAELYRRFVSYGFGRQRANLGKSYKKVFSHRQWKRLAQDLGFDVHALPTDLSFAQWLGVFQFFAEGIASGFAKLPTEMSTSSGAGPNAPIPARATRGYPDQSWKNRKSRQAR